MTRNDKPSLSILTADQLRDVKAGLVSRDEADIVDCVQQLMRVAENDETLDMIIRADVPVLLSEAVQPAHAKSNLAVYECLRALSNHRRFYTDGHGFIVSQSCCRSVAFLIHEPNETAQLHTVLELLSRILAGYEIFGQVVDRRLLLQLNDLLSSLTSKKTDDAETQFRTAVLLIAILEMTPLRFRENELRILLESTLRAFDSMTNLTQILDMGPTVDQVVPVTCSLAAQISRLLGLEDNQTGLDAASKAVALRRVSEFVVRIALPHVMCVPLLQFEENPTRVTSLFECIVSLLDNSEDDNQLVNDLSANRLLSLLPTVLCHSDAWENEKLTAISRKLLSRVLTSLSRASFQFPELWPEGADNFDKEVEAGVMAIPADPSLWLSTLSDPLKHRSAKLVILLFLYFQVLVEGSLSDSNTYSGVVRLLMDLNPATARGVITKTVWLILALCRVNLPSCELEVILKLSTLLEGHEHLDLLYTHHPTLLLLSFSTGDLPATLQADVMRLWLTNEQHHDEVLLELLHANEQARHTLLNLVKTSEEPVLTLAQTAYATLLAERDGTDDACVVWQLLPTVLTHACAGTILIPNLQKVIELAFVKTPEFQDQTNQSRAATLLPAAVSALDCPPLSIWRLAHKLLMMHIEAADYQVVTSYMQSETFLRKLILSVSSSPSDPQSVQYCLKIAACLSKVLREENVPKFTVNVDLDLTKILHFVCCSDAATRHAALLFVTELLQSKWSPRICNVQSATTDVLRVAFFHLLNAAILEPSEEHWGCLTNFLQLFAEDEPFAQHFIRSHWLLHLIETQISLISESAAMLDFIFLWFSMRKPRSVSTRSLRPPLDCTTVAILAEELLTNFQPRMLPLLDKIYQSKEIFDPEMTKCMQYTISTGRPPFQRIEVATPKAQQKEQNPKVLCNTIDLDSEPMCASQPDEPKQEWAYSQKQPFDLFSETPVSDFTFFGSQAVPSTGKSLDGRRIKVSSTPANEGKVSSKGVECRRSLNMNTPRPSEEAQKEMERPFRGGNLLGQNDRPVQPKQTLGTVPELHEGFSSQLPQATPAGHADNWGNTQNFNGQSERFLGQVQKSQKVRNLAGSRNFGAQNNAAMAQENSQCQCVMCPDEMTQSQAEPRKEPSQIVSAKKVGSGAKKTVSFSQQPVSESQVKKRRSRAKALAKKDSCTEITEDLFGIEPIDELFSADDFSLGAETAKAFEPSSLVDAQAKNQETLVKAANLEKHTRIGDNVAVPRDVSCLEKPKVPEGQKRTDNLDGLFNCEIPALFHGEGKENVGKETEKSKDFLAVSPILLRQKNIDNFTTELILCAESGNFLPGPTDGSKNLIDQADQAETLKKTEWEICRPESNKVEISTYDNFLKRIERFKQVKRNGSDEQDRPNVSIKRTVKRTGTPSVAKLTNIGGAVLKDNTGKNQQQKSAVDGKENSQPASEVPNQNADAKVSCNKTAKFQRNISSYFPKTAKDRIVCSSIYLDSPNSVLSLPSSPLDKKNEA